MALVEQSARIGTPTIVAQLTQFDKLLALHDEVTTGKHPRVKLSTAGQPAGRALAAAGAGSATTKLSTPAAAPPKPLEKVTTSSSSLLTAAQQSKPVPSSSARIPTEPSTRPRATASDFDPIFLTKSDNLIRAEKRLERERVEKALKEQVQSRRLAEKREIEQQDALPDFDVSEVLQRALELVKPLLASEVIAANVNGSASDSVDNHTLYSSQAESEPEERADLRATKPCKYYFIEGHCRKGDRCDWSHDAAFKRKMQDPRATEDNSRDVESDPQPRGGRGRYSYGRNEDSSGRAAEEGEIDEGSYSPPRAPPVPLAHEDFHENPSGTNVPQYTPNRRRASAQQPMNDGKIIRSHITSPLAPQPSHMSPFVVDKMSRAERVPDDSDTRRNRGSGRAARAQYVDTAGQISSSDSIVVTKKRRRGASPTEVHRNVAPRRPMNASPVIKDEPVSPAPLAQYAARQYADVEEVASPMVYQPTHARRASGYDSGRERVYVDVPETYRVMTPSRRVVSGAGPYERREPELRRIVSARPPEAYVEHHERHPVAYAPRVEAPGEYFPTRRSVSRPTIVDVEPPVVYRASVQPQAAHLRPASSMGPGRYSPIQREPRLAPRRIVMDQYGNQYYEAAPPPEPSHRTSYSMVPEVPTRGYEYARSERAGGYEAYRRASPEAPPSPGYVTYREIQPPPPPSAPPMRTSSRALSHVPPPSAAQAMPPPMPGSVVYEQGSDGGYRARAMPRASTAGGRGRDPRAREYDPGAMAPPPPAAAAATGTARPRYYDTVDAGPRERYVESAPPARYYAAAGAGAVAGGGAQAPPSPVVYAARRAYAADEMQLASSPRGTHMQHHAARSGGGGPRGSLRDAVVPVEAAAYGRYE